MEKVTEALVAAEAKLFSEEDTVCQAEDRLRVLRQEEAVGGVQESPPATIPANFAQEFGAVAGISCRSCRGRGTSCARSSQGEHRKTPTRKTNKSLSTPSLELAHSSSQVGFAAQGSGRDLSTMMETLIDQAESAARSGSLATLHKTSRE